jgi:glycosyltransferase involved in cell wall biosynthesis
MDSQTNTKIPLSVAIVAMNEESKIRRCLESVLFADDIVLVDSHSTDKTPEIAREYGCRVFIEDWKGDGPQVNSALGKCKNEWVLVVDADERVPEDTREELVKWISHPKTVESYRLPRRNFFHGKWIKGCDWWPDEAVRLLKKETGHYESLSHKRWESPGRQGTFPLPLEHFSYNNYSDLLTMMENRSNIMAKEMFDEGKRAKALDPISHGIGMFFKLYLLKRGFLDGFDGLIICMARAAGSFFKYAKLWELQYYRDWTHTDRK